MPKRRANGEGVLPLDASLALCREAGVETSHILAMQGPFSEEMDEAMLRAVSAQWLVTKDGGEAGGFAAKAAAAPAIFHFFKKFFNPDKGLPD